MTTTIDPPRTQPAAPPLFETLDVPLDARTPSGPIADAWEQQRFQLKLVNPANRRRYTIVIVGSGLAGGAAAATLGEAGYNVKCFCYQDSPRRAHSIAAQGGINAAKNYRNDGDSIHRLFYDTVKGGDFRSRESNVHRLAELSVNIIDQCVAQGVPFAREYGGLLDTRSFGGAQVSRTFYARGQTGQQLLIGVYQALERQIAEGTVTMYPRHEMLELVQVDHAARGIITRDMVNGEIEAHAGDVVILATGGYSTVVYLLSTGRGCNTTHLWRAHKQGAAFANPCYTQIHPTCIPQSGEYQSKLTLMSESLRNDGRVWVPMKPGDTRPPNQIPESERDYYLERKYPSFGNLAPRDIASRAAKEVCDEGRGVGPGGRGPARVDVTHAAFQEAKQAVAERINRLLSINGQRTVDSIYRELGTLMWNNAGMARSDASLREALARIPSLRDEFWHNVRVAGDNEEINQSLERAGRVADFLELAELLCIDALHRTESCGAHFRVESQTEEGEALRDDEDFAYVAAWQYGGEGKRPLLRKEPLDFENVNLAVRSYK